MRPIYKRVVSGLLGAIMILSVICSLAVMFSINANAAVTPVYEYTPAMMTQTSSTRGCQVRQRGFGSSTYARFTVDGTSDPQVMFSNVPTVSVDDKYIAIKYKTQSSMTMGCFYFLGAEPPASFVYNNNNSWQTLVVDASTAGVNWLGMQFVRYDPFNSTTIVEDNTIDIQYISFFSSKAKAHSYNGTVCTEGDLTVNYVESSNSISVTGYSGNGGTVTIEPKYDGITVTSVGANAFSSAPAGTIISIPESVTSISSSAFSGSQNNITLSVSYGSYAHTYAIENGLDFITEASISDFKVEYTDKDATVVGYLGKGGEVAIPQYMNGFPTVAIADNAFKNNSNITSLAIPDTVKSIGDEAFAGCSALTEVDFPSSSLESLGKSSFRNCTALKSISIPSSVTDISDFTFLGCTSLKSAVIEEGVKRIGLRSFSETALTTVNLPKSLNTLGKYAFLKTSSLVSITVASGNPYYSASKGALLSANACDLIYVPEGNTTYTPTSYISTVGRGAFYNTSRTSIELPSSVTSVSDRAFAGSSSLKSVTLPRSVDSVGYDILNNSSSATLKCYNKSYAHKYAETFDLPYELLIEAVEPYDANGDGVINSKDIIEIKLYINDNTYFIYETAADVNNDGAIDAKDLELISEMIFSSTQ